MDVILLQFALASRLIALTVLVAAYTGVIRWVKLDNPVDGRYLGWS